MGIAITPEKKSAPSARINVFVCVITWLFYDDTGAHEAQNRPAFSGRCRSLPSMIWAGSKGLISALRHPCVAANVAYLRPPCTRNLHKPHKKNNKQPFGPLVQQPVCFSAPCRKAIKIWTSPRRPMALLSQRRPRLPIRHPSRPRPGSISAKSCRSLASTNAKTGNDTGWWTLWTASRFSKPIWLCRQHRIVRRVRADFWRRGRPFVQPHVPRWGWRAGSTGAARWFEGQKGSPLPDPASLPLGDLLDGRGQTRGPRPPTHRPFGGGREARQRGAEVLPARHRRCRDPRKNWTLHGMGLCVR